MSEPETETPATGALDRFQALRLQAARVFKPATPITTRSLFAGRVAELQRVLDAVSQPGQHVIIYGERGVGKTSLANVLRPLLAAIGHRAHVVKVNCDSNDTFGGAWLKVFQELSTRTERPRSGFAAEAEGQDRPPKFPSRPTSHNIRRILTQMAPSVLVLDEFDRLPAQEARAFTDVIKTLSDFDVDATVVFVGVADTVDELIADHASVDRALVQVHMPRMSDDELREIVDKGAEELGVTFADDTARHVVLFSQGLPHYTHLLALEALRTALANERTQVIPEDLQVGLASAVEGSRQTTKRLHHQATSSARPDALFRQVLLACALAPKDELSFFRSTDVVTPLSTITGKGYETSGFARHLKEFCSADRGPVLERVGDRRSFVYRFTNPLMEPYVVMHGVSAGLVDRDALEELRADLRGTREG